jgi:effector-binding domain-containing protein
MTRTLATTLTLAFALWVPASAMAIDEPSFRVIESAPPVEIRDYAPFVVAETRVAGGFRDVGNEGFRRLFAYISGENRGAMKVAMTAPVTQQAASEKIAMTAPVTQQADGDVYRITFVLPSQYTLESAPVPTNPDVRLVQVPARRVVAVRYSGLWSAENYKEALAELTAFAQLRGLKLTGEPLYARYDPPFMPWFLRRNEILVEVAR